MAETAKWYVIHTYSGYENTVKTTIEKTVETRHLQSQILAVFIPMETVTEISEQGVKPYERKVYPGYVLVKMVYSDNIWHVIRNIRGVTGFVGTSSNDPIPLTEEEVYAMGVIEKKEIVLNYEVGDSVRILFGPLSDQVGVVGSIDAENNSVSVIVSMFGGRENSFEFELDQIEVISQ